MSLEHFVKMHSRSAGEYIFEPMQVYLYPWSSSQDSAVASDGVATQAIKTVADHLYDYGAIDYYAIYRWDHDSSTTNYPEWGDIDNCSYGGIEDNFRAFLENGDPGSTCGSVPSNGTNYNHYNKTGVHQLIHGGSTGCNETEGYAPAGAGAESWGQTAFNEGRVAWSPVCSSTSLTEAAAAQEALHMFMHPDHDETNTCNSDPRQHSVGTLRFYSEYGLTYCTPMLAYHWDDFDSHNEDPNCPCPVDRETEPTSHSLDITTCSKESVKKTADNMA